MATVGLNDDQQRILRTLVQYARSGKIDGYFHPFPTDKPAEYVIHLAGAPSYRFEGLENLQFLSKIGLLEAKWDRTGLGQFFALNKASYDAVEEGFSTVRVASEASHDLNAIVHAMTGGQLLVSDLANEVNFADALQDVEARDTLINDLIESLRKEMLPLLPKDRQVSYDNSMRRLNSMLKSAFSNPNSVHNCIRELAFMDGQPVDQTILHRPWPFLYPLLLIIVDRAG